MGTGERCRTVLLKGSVTVVNVAECIVTYHRERRADVGEVTQGAVEVLVAIGVAGSDYDLGNQGVTERLADGGTAQYAGRGLSARRVGALVYGLTLRLVADGAGLRCVAGRGCEAVTDRESVPDAAGHTDLRLGAGSREILVSSRAALSHSALRAGLGILAGGV